MINLDKVATFRLSAQEHADVESFAKVLTETAKGIDIIKNQQIKRYLSEIQEEKDRKAKAVTMGDIFRLGIKLLVMEHRSIINEWKKLDEKSKADKNALADKY
jgi:hypothetical protein